MDAHDRNHDGRVSRTEKLFSYAPHPHIAARKEQGPVTLADQHGENLNGRLAAWGTKVFGSMPTFYAFVIYGALGAVWVSAQATLLYWSNWIQLWSLPLLMVGALVVGRMAERRAQQTFLDAEAILDQAAQMQQHLAAQDAVSLKIQEHLLAQDAELSRLAAVHSLVADLHGQLATPPPEGTTS